MDSFSHTARIVGCTCRNDSAPAERMEEEEPFDTQGTAICAKGRVNDSLDCPSSSSPRSPRVDSHFATAGDRVRAHAVKVRCFTAGALCK